MWLRLKELSNQPENGLQEVSYSKIHKATVNDKSGELRLWITLAEGRIFTKISG
jgi:hypothetical protein